jgi:hypothetical protein
MSLREAAEQVIKHSRLHFVENEQNSHLLAETVEISTDSFMGLINAVADEKRRDADAVEPGLKALRVAIWGEEGQ